MASICRFTIPCRPCRADFRRAIGVGPEDFLIGFVGRLAWEKGPDKFLKAAEYILQRRPEVHFAMIGTGAMERDLIAAAKRAGIDTRFHMAGLWRETNMVYPSLDLMLHTSRADAMPLAILEAMASGVPVVAIGVGGVPEIIETGETGILVGTNEWPGIVSEYPGDWEGVAEAALALIGQPERLRRMSIRSVSRAQANYDIRQSAAMTSQIFRQMLRSPKDRLACIRFRRQITDGKRAGRFFFVTPPGSVRPSQVLWPARGPAEILPSRACRRTGDKPFLLPGKTSDGPR